MMARIPHFVTLIAVCLVFISPALAQDNPYRHISEITRADIPVNVESGIAKVSDSSNVTFSGAEYTHTLGRVSIRMKPLMNGVNEGIILMGNTHISGVKTQVKYSVYRNLIKEEITLKSPETVRYSYDLWLSDWVTKQINPSNLHHVRGWNQTEIESDVLGNETINYAKDSTIDIQSDQWGNLVVYVNNKNVVVMPKPFAIDATGKRFELRYDLDKKNKIITITGNLTGAQYPLVIDPTERVTNGGFETGDFSGWTVGSTCSGYWHAGVYSWFGYPLVYFSTSSPNCHVSVGQPVDLTNVDTINVELAADPWNEEPGEAGTRVFIDNDQVLNVNYLVDDAVFNIDTSAYSGTHIVSVRLYGGNYGADGIIYKVSAMGDDPIPAADFSASPISGPAPLTVSFTDTSTDSPNSWSWSFGDGNTSTQQNPSHIYENTGTYTVSLTAANAGGNDTEEKVGYINVTGDLGPVADFAATPTSGDRPLTVQFTDNSTGSPTNWSWDFNNDGTIDSNDQNPQHTYNEIGSYSVNLTVTNAYGNDVMTKNGYITVTGYYYVYADGVGLYYDGLNTPTFEANQIPVDFYNNITGKQGTPSSYVWQGISDPINNATGSRNWNINEDANSMANNADFALHAGHGWNNGFKFGTENYSYDMNREDMLFGGNHGRAKWVALFSCSVLNQSNQQNWTSVFNGLHILMSFDTDGVLEIHQGSQFAQRMTGYGIYPKVKISEAWMKTLQDTINHVSVKGAYKSVYPCENDYLPGFGTFQEPQKDSNGQYNISYTSFNCGKES